MIRICICDDDVEDLSLNEALVTKFCEDRGLKYKIKTFLNPLDLLEKVGEFEIFVLDMQMEYMNGIDVAQNIRLENKDSFIIAVTGFLDYADAALVIGLDGYVWKAVNEEKLRSVMERGVRYCQSKRYKIQVLGDDRDRFDVDVKEVLCVYTNNRKAQVRTLKGEYFCVMAFNDLREELLELDFAEVGKKYLVNLIFVKGISKGWVSFGVRDLGLKEFFRRGYEVSFRERLSSYGRRRR